jgi:predicted secreted protein
MTTTTTHQYGRDITLKISDGLGAFVNVGGQTTLSKKVSTDKIDFSSKDDGRIKASGFGQQEISFSVAGKLKLPDAGFSRVQTIANASPPECDIQVVRGATVLFQGTIGMGNLSWDAATNSAVNYSFDMTAVSLPTIDDVTAV